MRGIKDVLRPILHNVAKPSNRETHFVREDLRYLTLYVTNKFYPFSTRRGRQDDSSERDARLWQLSEKVVTEGLTQEEQAEKDILQTQETEEVKGAILQLANREGIKGK